MALLRVKAVSTMVVLSASACTIIDLDPLSSGIGGTTGSGASIGTSIGSSGTGASATSTDTAGATASTADASSSEGSTATGCAPSHCTTSNADHCFDFDDGVLPDGFMTNADNAIGNLDVATAPDDSCSKALRSELTGFVDPAENAYFQHGVGFDVSQATQGVRAAFRTFTAVAPATSASVGVINWVTGETTCQVVLFLDNPPAQSARFFLQSRVGFGAWSLDASAATTLATPFLGRWVDFQLRLLVSGTDLHFELSADGTAPVTAEALASNCAAVPTDGLMTVWLGPNYANAVQTSFYDDFEVDVE